jgi:hypothetical protein
MSAVDIMAVAIPVACALLLLAIVAVTKPVYRWLDDASGEGF